jgi:hypothetical protein
MNFEAALTIAGGGFVRKLQEEKIQSTSITSGVIFSYCP